MKATEKKAKLHLKKMAVSNLSDVFLNSIKGGEAEQQFTTSHRRCTGFTCCEPMPTVLGCSVTICGVCFPSTIY
jgi:hypothetical protein